jgi:hypothetical protein
LLIVKKKNIKPTPSPFKLAKGFLWTNTTNSIATFNVQLNVHGGSSFFSLSVAQTVYLSTGSSTFTNYLTPITLLYQAHTYSGLRNLIGLEF